MPTYVCFVFCKETRLTDIREQLQLAKAMVSGLVLERKAVEAQLAAVKKAARTAGPNIFQIFIRPPVGAIKTYEVKGSQTIKSLKVRIMQDYVSKLTTRS